MSPRPNACVEALRSLVSQAERLNSLGSGLGQSATQLQRFGEDNVEGRGVMRRATKEEPIDAAAKRRQQARAGATPVNGARIDPRLRCKHVFQPGTDYAYVLC